MSVLIKGMEMPKACHDCPIEYDGIYCNLQDHEHTIDIIKDEKEPDCPLVSVQTPHGRLIDADAFDERVRVAGGMSEEELTEDFKDGVQTVLYMLSKQPTIIEAEGSEA